MWTKRQLIEEAFGEIALAGYAFDLSPEEMQAGLRRLDTMLATWAGAGVHLGYALSTSPGSGDLDDDSGLKAVDVEAVYMALALRIAAGKGKQLAASTRTAAGQAYQALLSRVARGEMREQAFAAGVPSGAASAAASGRPFLAPHNTSTLQPSADGGLQSLGAL